MSSTESGGARWIGDYFIDGELGRGAMGVVYRVRHRNGEGPFALKLLKSETLEDSRALKRFAAEVGSQKALGEYPGIVGVVDSGFVSRGPFYVMPMVEGTNLRQLLREDQLLPEATSLRYIGDVARALAFAHDRGFVHRDVKPENVMVTPEGEVFLTDFGIVRVLGGLNQLTRTGEILGTPLFMAPEQVSLDFGKPGPATDVYAVGVMLYQILCKRSPYEAATSVALMSAIMQGDAYPPPRALRPGLNEAWVEILDGCLAREPRDRYRNAAALWVDLEPALAGPIDSRTRSGVIGGLIVLGLAVGGVAFATRGLGAKSPTPSPSASVAGAPGAAPGSTPTQTQAPTPAHSPTPTLALRSRLHAAWTSGDERALLSAFEAASPGGAEEVTVLARYRGLAKARRSWRRRLQAIRFKSDLERLRAEALELLESDQDRQLSLLLHGILATLEDLEGVRGPEGKLFSFKTGPLPAWGAIMHAVALSRPEAALERWPPKVKALQRARLSAWLGDLRACRASLEEVPLGQRAALGWSLASFVDPRALDLPQIPSERDKDPEAFYEVTLAQAEHALATGDPFSSVRLLSMVLARVGGTPLLVARARLGLVRSYLALGQAQSAARTWLRQSPGFEGSLLVRAEWVGLGALLSASLDPESDAELRERLSAVRPELFGLLRSGSPWADLYDPGTAPRPIRPRFLRVGSDPSKHLLVNLLPHHKRVRFLILARWLSFLSGAAPEREPRQVLSGLALWAACRATAREGGAAAVEAERADYAARYEAPPFRAERSAEFRLHLLWPQLLHATLSGRLDASLDERAAAALTGLATMPRHLQAEPLLKKVLEGHELFRAAYEAKLAGALGPR